MEDDNEVFKQNRMSLVTVLYGLADEITLIGLPTEAATLVLEAANVIRMYNSLAYSDVEN